MYKILQLFTSFIKLKINLFTGIKVIENTFTHVYSDTKVSKNAKLIKVWVGLKLFIVLGLKKQHSTFQ